MRTIIEVGLYLLALPAWAILGRIVPGSKGVHFDPLGHLVSPFCLCCATVALQRLLRRVPHSWPVAAMIAGYGLLAALFLTAALSKAN